MARANSSGLPYLLNRPDAGQFAYHRAFGSDLVPFLRGTLHPSWTTRTTPLEGRIVLKLSLGTGDKKLAATRWTRSIRSFSGMFARPKIGLRRRAM